MNCNEVKIICETITIIVAIVAATVIGLTVLNYSKQQDLESQDEE